jgi:tripartite-type tricarboxylate transporter receptor subunit TctC
MISRLCSLWMLAAVFTAAAAAHSEAQSIQYPTRPITMVVPFAPGGGTDIVARVIAQHMGKELGQNVVVDNRPAAGGNVGAAAVAKSPPDGHMLLLAATNNIVINPYLYKNLPFDPLTDLVPVALVADAPLIIVVSTAVAAQNLREFIALAREKRGALNYGSAGVGTMPHLGGDRLARMMGAEIVHIPFRGSSAALKEVASGEVQVMLATQATAEPLVDAGKIRMLAIASPRRLATLPDLPTTAEAGLPGYEISNWWGVLAAKGTSPEIVKVLNTTLRKMFDDSGNSTLLTRQGIIPLQGTADDFAKRIQSDSQIWKDIVGASGVRLE